MSNFSAREEACGNYFSSLGRVYHFYSAEKFPTFLLSDEDFGMAMNVFALVCAYWREQVRVLTFQLMSNHLHIIACGQRDDIWKMVTLFVKLLQRKFEAEGRDGCLTGIDVGFSEIDSLDYARKGIAYVNRNGFVAHHDWSPMTYPWGANRLYFNPELKSLHRNLGKELKLNEKRDITRSKKFDGVEGIKMVAGIVSPIYYCDIQAGEQLFRDARHYFETVTRSVEGLSEVAAHIGETSFLVDTDVYNIAFRIAKSEFKVPSISRLDMKSRISIAKTLHYEYYASKKQICRILHLTEEAAMALFGEKD